MKILLFSLLIAAALVPFNSAQVTLPALADPIKEAHILYTAGKKQEAIDKLEEYLVNEPTRVEVLARVAAIYFELEEYSHAEDSYRSAIEIEPSNAKLHFGLCTVLAKQSRLFDAADECEIATRLEPGLDSLAGFTLTLIPLISQSQSDIQSRIDLTLARFPYSEPVLEAAANFYFDSRNFSYAATLLERLIGIAPDVPYYHGLLAASYLRSERDERSLIHARRALELDQNEPYANYAMGFIFEDLGQHQEAADSFSRVPAGKRGIADASLRRAISETTLKNFDTAIDLLQELAQLSPDDIETQFHLANALLDARRFEEAVLSYTKLIELQPGQPSNIANRGLAYMLSYRFDEAIADYEKALRLSPGNETIQMLFRVGRVRSGLSAQVPGMLQDVRAEPRNVPLLVSLVESLAYIGRIDEAEEYIQQLYKIGPRDPQVYLRIAIAYGESGKDERSIDALKRSIAKKETAAAYLNLARALSRTRDMDGATAAYEKFMTFEVTEGTSTLIWMYGQHLETIGKRRDALNIYRRALAAKATDANALFSAGIMSLKLNEEDNAKIYLETLKQVDPRKAQILQKAILLSPW